MANTAAPTHDFKFCLVKWSTSRSRFSSQIEKLRNLIQRDVPDVLIVVGIPRHHAKKIGQQSWTKDFYVSKESRAMTEKRAGAPGTPTPVTVVFSRFPFFSEQWFPLEASPTLTTTQEEEDAAPPLGLAHVAEVCIPLNAWHPDRSPVGLLQEYQLTYDEVSMITFVVAPGATDIEKLNETFATVRNTVVFVLPPELDGVAVEDLVSPEGVGTNKMKVAVHPRLWRIADQTNGVISLSSTLGFGGSGMEAGSDSE